MLAAQIARGSLQPEELVEVAAAVGELRDDAQWFALGADGQDPRHSGAVRKGRGGVVHVGQEAVAAIG